MRIALAVLLCVVLGGTASAQEVKPWGSRDFSSRRVAVPKAGAGPRLVQINPAEEPYYLTPARPPGSAPARSPGGATGSMDGSSTAAWFWSGVSPALTGASSDRLADAVGRLGLADRPIAPRWSDLAGMVSKHGETLESAASGTRVSPALALAVMAVESAGRTDAVSTAGAQGLMQLMPPTAARFGVRNPLEPEQNIAGGVAYLNFLLKAFGDDPILAIAAYNAGEGAVAEHGGVPPYRETRDYVPKVLGAWTVARMFCTRPPDRVTDPCSFHRTVAGG